MTVFKQESPSPTMNDQLQRRNRQSPTSTQQGSIAFSHATGNVEESSQNMFSNTINQLLSQTGLTTLHNVIDGELWDARTKFFKYQVRTIKIKTERNYLNQFEFQCGFKFYPAFLSPWRVKFIFDNTGEIWISLSRAVLKKMIFAVF